MCDRIELTEKVYDALDAKDKLAIDAVKNFYGVEILEYEKQDDQIRPTLINGRPVPRPNWPMVVRIGNRSCTGTIVGPNCAITAAHCGRNNSRSVLELHDGSTHAYRMVHHPRYRSNGAQWDAAVLVLDTDIALTEYASVGINHRFEVGQDVDILGYGCIRPGGGGGNDGVLRFGESKIVSTNVGTDVASSWRQGNGGALCYGDSGGPMLQNFSDTQDKVLIAINSKGNIRDYNLNMRLDLPEVESWLRSTANRYDLKMYGVNAGDSPDPPEPPDPDPGPDTLRAEVAEKFSMLSKDFANYAKQLLERPNGTNSSDFGPWE